MLKSLELTNFKSFAGEPQKIPFAPVTIFVGANGSGKSNVFDALRFLQGIRPDLDLSIVDILDGETGTAGTVYPGLRGGAKEACWHNEKSFILRTSLTVIDDPEFHTVIDIATRERYSTVTQDQLSTTPIDLDHEIVVEIDNSPIVLKESLHRKKDDLSKECVLEFLRGDKTKTQSTCRFGSRRPFGIDKRHFDSSLLKIANGLAGFDDWPTVVAFYDKLTRFQFVNLRPSEMREYVYLHKTQLGPEGENVSAIVRRICQDPVDKERLLEWISSLTAPPISDIRFEETRYEHVLAELVEHDQSEKVISVRSISDGTLRFMGLLAAMFSAPEGSVLLFEEIENGLHPTRIHLMVELFEQFAAERNIQIIATTHSSQVLLGLSQQALQDVVLFAREEDHPGTVVKRLGELEHFDEVTKKTRIDELFTSGWLEFAV